MAKHLLTILFLFLAGVGGYFIGHEQYLQREGEISTLHCKLGTRLHRLWAEHAFWMRGYLLSALAENSDTHPTFDRLLKNQEDIGNALIPYYGKEAGHRLTKLLKSHIVITREVIAASKSGNQSKLKESNKNWYTNALEIAEFLSSANPYLPQDALMRMFNAHLSLTADEIAARLNKDWKEDIASFDKIFEQILDMSDHITEGIVQQFPQKFYEQ